MKQQFSVLFGGEAGYGTMSAGNMLAKSAVRQGFWAHTQAEFPSLIKGGLNTSHVVICSDKVVAANPEVDFLGVVSQAAFDVNISRLKPQGILLYDEDKVTIAPEKLPDAIVAIGISLKSYLPEGAPNVMSNSALVAAFSSLTGFPAAWLRETLIAEFESKPKLVEQNQVMFDQALKDFQDKGRVLWRGISKSKTQRMMINGNDAIALGALSAGVRFSAGYPMTPGTSVISFLSDHAEAFGLVFKQAEDELAAMNMLVGASFAGARTLGSTSGGGYALMTEALGYAAQAEIPVTMVIAQRGGPSTGLPTRTMQTDLPAALYGGAGEFPRIVVAPGDPDECFLETFRTINFADQYQLPAIILTDKDLADSVTTVAPFETKSLINERRSVIKVAETPYARYRYTDSGISPRTFPGISGGEHIATSYTHQEDGFYSSGNHEFAELEPEITQKSIDKLYQKFAGLHKEISDLRCGYKLYGPKKADLTLVVWGSVKNAALEALEEAQFKGRQVNCLQLIYLSPFPKEEVIRILSGGQRLLSIEGNATAQLTQLIRQETGLLIENQFLKYNSRSFTPREIVQKIEEVLSQ